MTTGLYLNQALRIGLSISDLDILSIGMIQDIFTERANDSYDYAYIATQADFDRL